jgi:transcriptional regulator with XRE-family HTH domain
MDANKPEYRFDLRSQMAKAEFRSGAEFAKDIGVSQSTMSSILNGWQYPSPNAQVRMARGLGISLKELGRLL